MNLRSPAKINLFLQITGKRTDGYHELLSLMCPLALHDRVSLVFGGDRISIDCSTAEVPTGAGNLAYRAADLFFQRMGKAASDHTRGLHIGIQKKIPVAAGLGGGSSNAASVLLGLNRYFKHPFSTSELMKIGLALGADVPFFIFQRPAVATGVGEELISVAKMRPFTVVTITPDFGVSTALVYKNLNFKLTKDIHKFKFPSFSEQGFDPLRFLSNDLEAVTVSMFPKVAAIKEALLQKGAMGALMSGSGPTVFGLFADKNTAGYAYHEFAKNRAWKVYLTRLRV